MRGCAEPSTARASLERCPRPSRRTVRGARRAAGRAAARRRAQRRRRGGRARRRAAAQGGAGACRRVDAPPAWLGALALPDEAGDPRRADELLLPDAALRAVLAADAPLGVVGVTEPWDGLLALGVLDTFAVVQDDAPTGPDHDLDDEEAWWDTVADDPPALLLAVRDLDLVDVDAWPAALRLLAGQARTLAALRVRGGYAGWWLARHARLGGRPPRHWRLPGASGLAGLYDPAPVDLPADLLTVAGVRAGLEIDGLVDAAALLDRLGDWGRTVTPAVVHAAGAPLSVASERLRP